MVRGGVALHPSSGSNHSHLFYAPAGSPSCGGDVAVYVFDINQPSLPTPFHFVLVSASVLMAFELYFIP